jgi:hypothetical protein
MSFVPEFAPDAKSQWRALDPILQELVLDEIERLAGNAPSQSRREFYHDFLYEDAGAFHYVFVRVFLDFTKGKLTVAGVVDYVRPK